MSDTARVTVLLPVWNEGQRASVALRSVLEQTFSDFDVLVLSDGANVETMDALLAVRDPRVRVLRFPHRGLARTLMAGAEHVRSEFIARMDADDFCARTRLATQMAWIDERPRCGVLGTAYAAVSDDLVPLYESHPPCGHDQLLQQLRTSTNPLCHGTVVMRRAAYLRAGGYRAGLPYAEDVDLWLRMSRVADLAAVDELLYTRRLRPESICHLHLDEVARCASLARSASPAASDSLTYTPVVAPDGSGEAERDRERRARRAAAFYHQECGYHLLMRAQFGAATGHLWRAVWLGRRDARHGKLLVAATLGVVLPGAMRRLITRRTTRRAAGVPSDERTASSAASSASLSGSAGPSTVRAGR
jgi:hypothetical protein